jgi:hypothetical protein
MLTAMRLAPVLTIVLAAHGAAGAERCPASAVVEGDAALVPAVRGALAARGVAVTPGPGCTAVRARIERDADEMSVDLTDGAGRRVERRATTVAAAATVIESWARTDLTDSLLEREGEYRAADVVVAPPRSAAGRPMIAVALEASIGSDGSLWTGPRVTGCAWLGPVCGGVTLRLGRDGGLSGDTQTLGGHRDGVDMMLSADVPARASVLVISPGIAAGFGWIRSHGRESDGDHVVLDWQGPRAEAHIALATPLIWGIWLYGAASATVLPSAETVFQMHDGALLAAEPRGFARIAIGLSSSEAP